MSQYIFNPGNWTPQPQTNPIRSSSKTWGLWHPYVMLAQSRYQPISFTNWVEISNFRCRIAQNARFLCLSGVWPLYCALWQPLSISWLYPTNLHGTQSVMLWCKFSSLLLCFAISDTGSRTCTWWLKIASLWCSQSNLATIDWHLWPALWVLPVSNHNQ